MVAEEIVTATAIGTGRRTTFSAGVVAVEIKHGGGESLQRDPWAAQNATA